MYLSINNKYYLLYISVNKYITCILQVSGEVYAVDEWTIILVNFNYDGTGDDTFFWAGDSGRPGPQGFIVPDQHGKSVYLRLMLQYQC